MEEVSLADTPELGQQRDESLLVMDDALDRLARTDPLKAQLIEMRHFAGMTVEESAALLSIPLRGARRQLRLAQAWLHKEMAG
jgi:DNA-directed RNA polymerase specialized sigma24 family protein